MKLTPPTAMRDKRVYATVAAVATAGLILGSFLPWARLSTPFGEFTKIALEDGDDGIITLALGTLAVWAVAYYYFGRGRERESSLILTALGLAAIVVAGVNLVATEGRASGILEEFEELASDGLSGEELAIELVAAEGLYMVLFAGTSLFLAGLAATFFPPNEVPATGDQPTPHGPDLESPNKEPKSKGSYPDPNISATLPQKSEEPSGREDR